MEVLYRGQESNCEEYEQDTMSDIRKSIQRHLSETTALNINILKGEGHSRNGVFFEINNKKITLS